MRGGEGGPRQSLPQHHLLGKELLRQHAVDPPAAAAASAAAAVGVTCGGLEGREGVGSAEAEAAAPLGVGMEGDMGWRAWMATEGASSRLMCCT